MAVAIGLALSACQVRPLYGESSAGASQSIAISAAGGRVEQVVRNELVFGFGGGSGEPLNPDYRMALEVVVISQGVLPANTANEFSAARVEVTASYEVRDAATQELLFSGKRRAVAALDNPDQEYGNTRAIRDAEDRAAREVAAFVRADVAGKLAARPR